MRTALPVLAGAVSTAIFALGAMPMLAKAARTKDLSSYSLSNIVLLNVGNVIHSVYVFHLPIGPVWILHTFYLVSTGLMLFWYLRYTHRRAARVSTPSSRVRRTRRTPAAATAARATPFT